METQRFLVAVLLVFMSSRNPCPAQPSASSAAVATPRWVALTVPSAAVANTIPNKLVISQSAILGDRGIQTRQSSPSNARLIGRGDLRLSGGVSGAKRFLKGLDNVIVIYDWATGGINDRELGIKATQTAASLGVGALTSAGAFWFAGAIGTASTGTAIGSLSGAAATSASLAWWGGGAVAAGGGGMAVGAAVISGGVIVVGAAAAIGVYKLWNIYDPAERDGMNNFIQGVQARPDLTSPTSTVGAILHAQRLQIDELKKRQ